MSELQRSEAAVTFLEVDSVLAEIKAQAEAVEITSPESYLAVGTIAAKLTALAKVVHTNLDPDIAKLREELANLMNARTLKIFPIEYLNATLTEKLKAYAREEKRLKDEEEQRINDALAAKHKQDAEENLVKRERAADEERRTAVAGIRKRQRSGELTRNEAEKLVRKARWLCGLAKAFAAGAAEEEACAPPPTATVKANLPAVAGRRFGSVLKWRMKNIHRVPRDFLYPLDINDCSNFPLITRFVKDSKSKTYAEKSIPGIEVYED
jgi:hypothetical protein